MAPSFLPKLNNLIGTDTDGGSLRLLDPFLGKKHFILWFLQKVISCHFALNCPKRTPPLPLPPPSHVMSFPAPRLVHGMFYCSQQNWKQNSTWQKIYYWFIGTTELSLILPADSGFWFRVLSAVINCSCAYHSVRVVSHRFVETRLDCRPKMTLPPPQHTHTREFCRHSLS